MKTRVSALEIVARSAFFFNRMGWTYNGPPEDPASVYHINDSLKHPAGWLEDFDKEREEWESEARKVFKWLEEAQKDNPHLRKVHKLITKEVQSHKNILSVAAIYATFRRCVSNREIFFKTNNKMLGKVGEEVEVSGTIYIVKEEIIEMHPERRSVTRIAVVTDDKHVCMFFPKTKGLYPGAQIKLKGIVKGKGSIGTRPITMLSRVEVLESTPLKIPKISESNA